MGYSRRGTLRSAAGMAQAARRLCVETDPNQPQNSRKTVGKNSEANQYKVAPSASAGAKIVA